MTLIVFSKSWYPAGLNWPVQALPRGHEISCHSSSIWESIDDADPAFFLQRSNEGGEFMAVGPIHEQAHDGDPVPHLSANQTTLYVLESRGHRHYSVFPNN